MKLSDFCISRPIFTLVINILLVVVGFVGYQRLEVRDLPKINSPTVSITTTYSGADAYLIESQITNRLEEALAGLEGLDSMRSATRDDMSQININFKSGYDINVGMNDIRDKIGTVTSLLPSDADAPLLEKVDSSGSATMYVSFIDTQRSPMALTDYVKNYIQPDVQQVEGVGTAEIYGAREYSMRIWPDPMRMAVRGVTVTDIANVLESQNVNIAGGQIKSNTRNYTLLPKTKLEDVDAFKDLILREDSGALVRLSDVAEVEIAALDDNVLVRSDGEPSVVLGVIPQSSANPVAMSKEIQTFLKSLDRILPLGMSYRVNYDKAVFIDASIKGVYSTLVEAVILVVLVVFGFLGSVRSTTVPLVTIPLCLIAIFGFLYVMGYSINNMTLLALVLAIGLVVDDAIVMLENVHRHMEEGMSAMQAAFKGSREIGFAIVAMTITLAAVYAPIGFTTGLTGDVFREFAFTLAGAVIISGFVALTLSPMMCARVLQTGHDNRYTRWLDATMERLKNRYMHLLKMLLQIRLRVVAGIVAVALLGLWLFTSLESELAPTEDTGTIIGIIAGPSSANLNYMDNQIKVMEQIFENIPESRAYVAIGGSPVTSQGFAFLSLSDWDERSRSQQEIIAQIAPNMLGNPGAYLIPESIPPLPTADNSPLQFVVQMMGTYDELRALMTVVEEEIAEDNPGIINVQVDLKMDAAQLDLVVNRELAADLGVELSEINNAIGILFAGRHITDFDSGSNSYDVKVQLPVDLRKNAEQLNQIYVRSTSGQVIPLSNLVNMQPIVGTESLSHYNRLRSATLTANLAPGYTVAYMDDLGLRLLGDSAKYTWTGQTKDFIESSGAMVGTTILALLFIYLVLAAQFESFRDPLIIMLTVPFSIVGAALLLKLTGGTNNLYTQIGFVTLIGLITKHGILITEFANQLRAQGMELRDAVIYAAGTRLRPILMTTGAMVLGAIPLALATGAGAYARQQLGWVIVGGMSFGTLFSLLVVPIAYTYLASKKVKPIVEAPAAS